MNLARTICAVRNQKIARQIEKNFRISCIKFESTQASQPKVQEEKFAFEDLNVLERKDRRKATIPPFMKDVFVSVFNRELLAYPEILDKDDNELLEKRLSTLSAVFDDPAKTQEDRINVLKQTKLYAGTVSWTKGGIDMNTTESLRYLEAISSDIALSQVLSDHWVAMEALRHGLSEDHYNHTIDELISGEHTISLCVKERLAERIALPDFRTKAELDGKGIWRITGEKVCVHPTDYQLVLCAVEGLRLKAMLVHPGAQGVTRHGVCVGYCGTPATPLNNISEGLLSQTLAVSRLHAASLVRCALTKTVNTCADYVRRKVLGGKPLSELSSIRATFGNALLDIYASESAEYFTAGLRDGYTEPDVELEMAMCRNFMATHSMSHVHNLLSLPALELPEQCSELLDEMRLLVLRGETLDSVNMFIALNGIHHAGKMMSEEIKQIRNPLLHPAFIIKKVWNNRHQEKDDPKLNLHLAEHLHPSLRLPAEQLEYCVVRMKYACETLMGRHGMEIATAFTELSRLGEAATEILAMTAVLARASRSYCIGVRNAENEMKLAACYVEKTKDRVKRLILDIGDGEYLNLDHFRIEFGKKLLDTKSLIVERPTARTFW